MESRQCWVPLHFVNLLRSAPVEPFWYYVSIYSMGYSKFDASALNWNSECLESGKIVLSLRTPSHNDKWPGFDVETLQSWMSFLTYHWANDFIQHRFNSYSKILHSMCWNHLLYSNMWGGGSVVCVPAFCDLLWSAPVKTFSHYLFYRFF
jgi:hypothetical protein